MAIKIDRQGEGKKKGVDAHLRVKYVGGRLDNAGHAIVSLDLEELALFIRNDSKELQANVLRHHVENEVERQGVRGTGRDRDVVTDRGQVAQDGGPARRLCGQWLRGHKHATNEGDVDGAIFVVGDLDQGLGRPAVDQLDAKDVRLGEGGLDYGFELCSWRNLGAHALIGRLGRKGGESLLHPPSDPYQCSLKLTYSSLCANTAATRSATKARADHLRLSISPTINWARTRRNKAKERGMFEGKRLEMPNFRAVSF